MHVADFLIERLENHDVKHVFGIPGDYVLGFYNKLSENENIELVNTTDEGHAGYAADAYARVHGIGAVCVTYCVGGLKVCNQIAGAYAERSPVVLISGSPGMKERSQHTLMHHMVRSFESQKEVFEKITCASAVLDNPYTAAFEIDRVFEALKRHKQPVYIELPRDIADKPISYDLKLGTPKPPQTDAENMAEALGEVEAWLKSAKSPIILAGIEIARCGLGGQLLKFAEKNNIPIATTFLSKSVVSERHPLFEGIYSGKISQPGVREKVENSDCLLCLGVMLTDFTLSFMPSKFKNRQTVFSSIGEGLRVRNHSFEDVYFNDFCEALFQSVPREGASEYKLSKYAPQFKASPKKSITLDRFFEKLDSVLTEDMAIIADTGNALFGASEIRVHNSNHFLSNAFYTSMGFSIPAALGIQKADPNIRPIVITGDGAFQMSCLELSTIIEHGLNPIVFVLNNGGYSTERFLLDGPFNDIRNWDYSAITKMLKGGESAMARTEGELEEAISIALKSSETYLIDVVLEPEDISGVLKRLTDSLSERI